MSEILQYLQSQQTAMVNMLAQWVNQDSPTYDKPAVDTMGRMVATAYQQAGGTLSAVHHQPIQGDHYTITYGEGNQQALILAHFDTVWPLGEAQRRPFSIVEGMGKGPGIHDMKAGTLIAKFALQALHHLQLKPRHKLIFLLTSDEEIGSPTSRPLIEMEALQSEYAFVFEGSIERGLTTARRGIGRFVLKIGGKAAHSGIEPEKGVSAIEELAHQIQALHAMSNHQQGVSVNVGVIFGGERPNVIAPHATAEIDLRITTPQDGERLFEQIRSLQPHLKGATLNISEELTRTPWPESPETVALFEKARVISEKLGMPTAKRRSGAGSDANFTGGLGVPTLDGLGSIGGGAHALSEHTELDMLPRRAALFAELLLAL